MKKNEEFWMPHAGHFICGPECQFVLNTYVNGYIVSTVGELPDPLKRIPGWKDIGLNRKYETMVFRAKKSQHECCPYEMVSGADLDFCGYNAPGDARRGHFRLLNKWKKKGAKR